MNANELADELEDALDTDSWCQECALETTKPIASKAATMLRQQQAEIEALKISLSGNSAEILSKNDETLPNGKCKLTEIIQHLENANYMGANKAATMLRQQQAKIEEWKRKYKDMHNLGTQAMSRVHELEKAQKK
jgi:hypothetical protein